MGNVLWLILILVAGPAALIAGLTVVILIVARVQGRAYRSAGRRVLVYLEAAARLGAPLPEMMEAAARTEGGKFGTRLWNMSTQIRAGRSVRDALAIATPEVPTRLRELIGAAERTGQLTEGLTDLLERERRADRLAVPTIEWLYPLGLLVVLLALLAGFLAFVWPRFKEIYADFDVYTSKLNPINLPHAWGLNLPEFSMSLLDLGVAGFAFISMLVALLSLAGLLVLSIVIFHRWASRPVPLLFAEMAGVLSALAGRLPFIGRAMRDRQLADACYVVASAVRAAMPLDAALLETQTLRLDPLLRRRLVRWSQRLNAGEPPVQAARRAGMPRLIAGMLATGQAAAQPAEAFDFLHRYYSGRFSRAMELLRGAIIPAAVLALGALVGLIVLAMLSPLFTIIDAYSKGNY